VLLNRDKVETICYAFKLYMYIHRYILSYEHNMLLYILNAAMVMLLITCIEKRDKGKVHNPYL